MKNIIFATCILFVTSGLGGCYGVLVTDKSQAIAMQRVHELKQLLNGLEEFNAENGRMPSALNELRNTNPAMRTIDFSLFSYYPDGLQMADGTSWLLSTPDPLEDGRFIVAGLPSVVERRPSTEVLSLRPQARGQNPQ